MTRLLGTFLWALLLAPPLAAAAYEPPAAEAPATEVPAAESSAEEGPEAIFARLDANEDGQIAEDEVPEDQARFFRRLRRTADANGDGLLSREEFAVGLTEREPPPVQPAAGQPGGNVDPAALFARLDRNGDEKVTLEEVPEARRESFTPLLERADRDGDGALSREEFARVAQRMARNRQPGAPAQTPPRAGAGGGRLFAALDTDGDGTLSAEEIVVAAESLSKLDANGDGAISRKELRPVGAPPNETQPKEVPPNEGLPNRQALRRAIRQSDRDGDGKLSRDEAPQRIRAVFDRVDNNGDGFLDDREARRQPRARPQSDAAAR